MDDRNSESPSQRQVNPMSSPRPIGPTTPPRQITPATVSRRIGPTTKILVIMAIVVAIPAGYGFSVRFYEFFNTLRADEDGRFTIVPMLNYLAVAAGFLCLFVWAVFHGMFQDIERPKYTMLENEEKLDRGEAIKRSA